MKQEHREHLKPLIRNIVHKHHYYSAHHQDDAVLCNRPPVVAALVRQCRRGAEHFYDRNEAKEKEYDPDYLVTFEYASE